MKFETSSDTAASDIPGYYDTTAEYIAVSESRTERKFLRALTGNEVTSEGDPEIWARIGSSQKTML